MGKVDVAFLKKAAKLYERALDLWVGGDAKQHEYFSWMRSQAYILRNLKIGDEIPKKFTEQVPAYSYSGCFDTRKFGVNTAIGACAAFGVVLVLALAIGAGVTLLFGVGILLGLLAVGFGIFRARPNPDLQSAAPHPTEVPELSSFHDFLKQFELHYDIPGLIVATSPTTFTEPGCGYTLVFSHPLWSEPNNGSSGQSPSQRRTL